MSLPPQPLPPTPFGPGWYSDPWQRDFERWFDGRQWTQSTRPVQRRPAIIGPLLAAAGVVAAIVFALQHPSVSVPLAGTQDCGSTSFQIATGLTPIDDSGEDPIVQALDQECRDKARHDVTLAVVLLAAGAIVGGAIGTQERRR